MYWCFNNDVYCLKSILWFCSFFCIKARFYFLTFLQLDIFVCLILSFLIGSWRCISGNRDDAIPLNLFPPLLLCFAASMKGDCIRRLRRCVTVTPPGIMWCKKTAVFLYRFLFPEFVETIVKIAIDILSIKMVVCPFIVLIYLFFLWNTPQKWCSIPRSTMCSFKLIQVINEITLIKFYMWEKSPSCL